MKIGIDGTSWFNNRGFGRFTREMLTALIDLDTEHDFVLFVDQQPDSNMLALEVQIVKISVSKPTTIAATAKRRRSILDMLKFYREVKKISIDVMYFPAVYSWFPIPRSIPSVVTFHDAIAEHYSHLVFPEKKRRLLWAVKVKLAILLSNRILTVSDAAKTEIINYLGVDSSRIDLTSEAPSTVFKVTSDFQAKNEVRSKYGIPSRVEYLMYVGGFAPHKNLEMLLHAFKAAASQIQNQEIHLVLVGDHSNESFLSNFDILQQTISDSELLISRVHLTGYVPDEDLSLLYNAASGLVFPSLSEGFGLPAVEAMACGLPVIASNQGSLPEVIGESGLYFDPIDEKDLTRTIMDFFNDKDLQSRLASSAVKRALLYTWPEAARQTLVSIGNAMKNS